MESRRCMLSHENKLLKVRIWLPGAHDATCRDYKLYPLTSLILSFRTPIQVNFMSFPSVFTIRTQQRIPFLQTPAQKIQIRQFTQILVNRRL